LRVASDDKKSKALKAALPSFKQYRESDGQFYFKLVDAQGKLLLQSAGYASPKDAGAAIKALQASATHEDAAVRAALQSLREAAE
jgi:tryptophanyl-tRNA synthetase